MDDKPEIDLLRFSTAGSVDDGKSTLIGRLLYDSGAIYTDVFSAMKKTSERAGKKDVDLAYLTDGLAAEREQGITIDVAYRYFSTPTRKFIIADTPGHEEYTRNMVTGASTANLAIVLIDARKGVLPQSKRHAVIAAMLKIPHIVVAINKMDLVDWSEDVFQTIEKEFSEFCGNLGLKDVVFIPVSALKGDNVVTRSENMPWFQGNTLLYKLEKVQIFADKNLVDLRFPVQTVLRPNQDYRGYAGQIASGVVNVGDEVMVLPSKKISKIKSIDKYEGSVDYAFSPESVSIVLEDEIDISRGDMIVRKDNLPEIATELDALICWMDENAMELDEPYYCKFNTLNTQVKIENLLYRLDINTLDKMESDSLQMNEVGKIRLHSQKPVIFDSYSDNRITGSFIIIDPYTNNTVGAGMILKESTGEDMPAIEYMI